MHSNWPIRKIYRKLYFKELTYSQQNHYKRTSTTSPKCKDQVQRHPLCMSTLTILCTSFTQAEPQANQKASWETMEERQCCCNTQCEEFTIWSLEEVCFAHQISVGCLVTPSSSMPHSSLALNLCCSKENPSAHPLPMSFGRSSTETRVSISEFSRTPLHFAHCNQDNQKIGFWRQIYQPT